MVTGALDATAQMGTSIKDGITKPVHEAADFVNAAKKTVDSFIKSASKSVESVLSGTKGGAESVVAGLRGFAGSLFAKKRKPVSYHAAAYRYNPAELTPPVRRSGESIDQDL